MCMYRTLKCIYMYIRGGGAHIYENGGLNMRNWLSHTPVTPKVKQHPEINEHSLSLLLCGEALAACFVLFCFLGGKITQRIR